MIKRKMQSEKRKTKTKNSKFLVLSCNFALCALSFTLLTGCQPQLYQKKARLLMGTIVEVTSNDARAAQIAFDEISRIEAMLSKYKDYSELAQLNKLGKLKVSPETLCLIRKSLEFWQASNGAFDITVGPLMDVWGFTDKKFRQPSDAKIKKALRLVGSDKIIIDETNGTVQLKIKGMRLDLGAAAKGYAVDSAIKKLKEAGVASALVNAGGDIYCLGDKSGKPWKVAVQNPRGKGYIDYIELKDRAVATSGDYEQYFEANGKRFSHIFNPKTGWPMASGVISATVIADDCLTADALATSIAVLGKDKGKALADKYGAKVEIVSE